MNINYNIKNLSDSEKAFFEQYAPKRIEQLNKWLKKYPNDSVIMDVNIEKFATKEAYKVKISLSVPNKNNFYATEDDHTIEEAVDKTKDKIKRQLLKEKDKNFL